MTMSDPEHTLPPGTASVDPFTIPKEKAFTPSAPPAGPSPIASPTPSKKQQQWGVVISIAIIVIMIIIGAFYAWGQRISQQYPPGLLVETGEVE